MSVDERCGSVVFTEEAAVDVVEAVSGDQAIPAGGTRETLEMVHIALCPHHQFTGGNGLTTRTASATVAK